MSQGEAVHGRKASWGAPAGGRGERSLQKSSEILRGNVGSWPASGDSVKGQGKANIPPSGSPTSPQMCFTTTWPVQQNSP